MSSTTDESESPRTGYKRVRIALISCFAAFCLAVFYVLLSAPLLLYAVHHPGSSSAELVNVYVRPLIQVDELLTPDFDEAGGDMDSFLNWYYGLWGSEVQEKFMWLQFENWLKSVMESMEEQTPILGAEGPDSGV